ncbi:MAG: hypothetical protein ACYTE8_09305, partial [Planctomycetota bacterium]
MLKRRSLLMLALAFSLLISSLLPAQDREYLNQLVESKFSQMREDGRQAFGGILFYPSDVREAVLELSQYPELVAKLSFIKNRSLSEAVIKADDVIKDYPEEAKAAAKTLNFYPEILDIMQQNLVMTGLIGAVYSDDKATIKETVNRLAENTNQEYNESVDDWAEILDDEPELIEELQAAQAGYAEWVAQPSTIQTYGNVQDYYCDDYGYYISDDGMPTVYGLPCYGYTSYVLYYPHRYPRISHWMLHHYWRRYPRPVHPIARPPGRPGGPDRPRPEQPIARPPGLPDRPGGPGLPEAGLPAQLPSDSIDGFYDAVRNWHEKYPETMDNSFLAEDGKRVDRLREFGQFQEQFNQERAKYSDLDRTSFLRRNPDKYPNLTNMEKARLARPQP